MPWEAHYLVVAMSIKIHLECVCPECDVWTCTPAACERCTPSSDRFIGLGSPGFILTFMSTAARIYIVRHGETKENRLGIMQGQLDTDLNEAGVDQALRTAGALENVPFTKAFSSPLKRAVKVGEKPPAHSLALHPRLIARPPC